MRLRKHRWRFVGHHGGPSGRIILRQECTRCRVQRDEGERSAPCCATVERSELDQQFDQRLAAFNNYRTVLDRQQVTAPARDRRAPVVRHRWEFQGLVHAKQVWWCATCGLLSDRNGNRRRVECDGAARELTAAEHELATIAAALKFRMLHPRGGLHLVDQAEIIPFERQRRGAG